MALSLESSTESDGPPSLESATDYAATISPPPSEVAYCINTESEVTHMGVPPNFGASPHSKYGQRLSSPKL